MKLGYVILYVPDVTAAVDFYKKAFGLERRFQHETSYAEMETGATTLAMCLESFAPTAGQFRLNRPGDPAPGIEIALVVPDVEVAFTRAVAAGAVQILAPTVKPWGQTVSYVRDLQGVLVELCSPLT